MRIKTYTHVSTGFTMGSHTHFNGIHFGISKQYTVSIKNSVEMCAFVLIVKVLLFNGI